MDNLPNGFTGFAHLPDGFESAAEASRRSRGIAPDPLHGRDAAQGGSGTQGAERAGAANGSARGGLAAASMKAGSGDSLQGIGAFTSSFAGNGGARAAQVVGKGLAEHTPAADAPPLDSVPGAERRWAWVEIDLAAVRHNLVQMRRFLRPDCKVMAVVKADAYGHGAVEVAKAVLGAGAERLAVATVDEAVALRDAGVTAPILLLSQPPEASIPLLVTYRIAPSVYEAPFAVAYGEAADRQGVRAPYHLVVNTGMNRIGVHYAEAVELLRQVDFHRALDLEGVFTHFATADCSETLDFQRQARRFAEALEAVRAAGFDPGLVHAANSAAAVRFPEVQFDMVRLGRALFGFHPCPETQGRIDLRPAMSVHARIVDARTLPMSEGVSTGLRYRSPGSVKICTVPLGFADGLPLALSGNADFIVSGRYVRQVGEICMDHCMFEVDLRSYGTRERIDPQIGEEVVIVGRQGAAEVTLGDLAQKLHATPIELALGFGHRLARVCR